MVYLSYLMGAKDIEDEEITSLGIEIVDTTPEGSRKLRIPSQKLNEYKELVRQKMTPGFWNEIVGTKEIVFIFRLKDKAVKEFVLSLENEAEIDKLCAELNSESPDKTANVYKYISENDFYHDFMVRHYSELINR